jgi:hypothetical protein
MHISAPAPPKEIAMSSRESRGDSDEFYRGIVYGNELSNSTWVGFLAATLLHGKYRG